jgi:hypothetical protein
MVRESNLDGVEIFFQTGSGAHSASYIMDTGLLPGVTCKRYRTRVHMFRKIRDMETTRVIAL